MTDRLAHGAETLQMSMAEIAKGDTRKAAELVRERYPFVPPVERQGISIIDRIRVFLRDGFIDRYGGVKLFFPPVLELISLEIPEAFPSHRNGKASETHVAHWELYPSVDHLVPLTRGGAHEMDNWVTRSMSRYQRRAT
jgi:5-methylcytosine-specific restriction endonuclease McrA